MKKPDRVYAVEIAYEKCTPLRILHTMKKSILRGYLLKDYIEESNRYCQLYY